MAPPGVCPCGWCAGLPQYASGWDPFGDHYGQRYYLVAEADAWRALRDNPLARDLELVQLPVGARHRDSR